MRRSVLLAPALAVLAALMISMAPGAGARTTVIVRDGSYGDITLLPNLLGFRVRDRKVSDVRAAILVTCRNSDTGESYDRSFAARHRSAVRIPASGNLRLRWTASDGGRRGTISVNVDFRGRRTTLASVDAQVGGGYEDCDGGWPFRLRRGPLPRTGR